jgi:hypothetical protein
MSFEDFKLLYVLSCIALGFIILSPTLAMVIKIPGGERFSELWILGSDHMAENYPSNVKEKEVYKVYLGVGNHLGSLEYYRVYVKLRNETEPVPSAVNGTPSTLEPLLEYHAFLSDNETWEKEILFSFEGVSFDGNISKVSKLVINGYTFEIDKVAMWDEERHGFYYQLFFELWLYNATASGFQFHSRFVWIWLNMMESA